MQPQFIQLPEIKVVGLGAKFISAMSPDKNNSDVIPKLWHQFIQRIDQIPNRKDHASLGLVERLPTADKSHPDALFYIAAAQVTDLDRVPTGMIHRVIPAGRYASFTHKGKLDSLPQTMKSIFVSWLPTSGVQLRPTPEIELYDERFNPGSEQSEFDILLPVQ